MDDDQLVSIPDFINITHIGERDLLALLSTGELDLQIGPMGEVLIDLTEVTPEKLAAAQPQTNSRSEIEDPLVVEAVASELVAALDPILDEALELALKW
ncbi:MAG: hypothetical protein KDD66_18020, partial [Bdellovibrionales bacterium]|nr:hypothetical protein [Bdellovibrionales bacterium]